MTQEHSAVGAGARTIVSATLLRWLACSMIFFHHYLKSIGQISNYGLSPIIAIGIFCLLAGAFSQSRINDTVGWLRKKIFRILVPAWIIGIPMLVLNMVVQAKPKGFFSVVMELIGLQFFVTPLFEATWFVTLILGLYLAVFLSGLAKKGRLALLALLCLMLYLVMNTWGTLEYLLGGKLAFWIIAFFMGYMLSNQTKNGLRAVDRWLNNRLAHRSYPPIPPIPDVTYYFYLVHPPVLYLLSRAAHFSPETCFFWGVFVSMTASFVVEKVDVSIQSRVSR